MIPLGRVGIVLSCLVRASHGYPLQAPTHQVQSRSIPEVQMGLDITSKSLSSAEGWNSDKQTNDEGTAKALKAFAVFLFTLNSPVALNPYKARCLEAKSRQITRWSQLDRRSAMPKLRTSVALLLDEPEPEKDPLQEARNRMRAMQNQSSELARGAGEAFGFGSEDDEEYGYGLRGSQAEGDPEYKTELGFEPPAWLTRDLTKGMGIKDKESSGFDGRPANWGRKAEMTDPNPPPMANTLRAPGAGRAIGHHVIHYRSDEARGVSPPPFETQTQGDEDIDEELEQLQDSLLENLQQALEDGD